MRIPTKSMPSKALPAYHGILPTSAKDPPHAATIVIGAPPEIGVSSQDLLAQLLIDQSA